MPSIGCRQIRRFTRQVCVFLSQSSTEYGKSSHCLSNDNGLKIFTACGRKRGSSFYLLKTCTWLVIRGSYVDMINRRCAQKSSLRASFERDCGSCTANVDYLRKKCEDAPIPLFQFILSDSVGRWAVLDFLKSVVLGYDGSLS